MIYENLPYTKEDFLIGVKEIYVNIKRSNLDLYKILGRIK
jgi:hypothetical protein